MAGNDHRTRVTRLMIRRAFTGLLQKKPIQTISIKELCAQAGISRGTFYAHYTDIYDLLSQLEEEMMEEVRRSLREMLGTSGELSVMKVTTELFRSLKENADLCTMALSPNGDKDFASRLLSIGQEYYIQAYRRYFADATSKQLKYYYAFVSKGCIGLLEQWLSDGMTSSAEEMANMAGRIMLYGVGFFDTKQSEA